jgi:hypothetical protein
MKQADFAHTRSARWASNSAIVPRIGLRPNFVLDFVALDTQCTLLVRVGIIFGLVGSTVLVNEREI